MGARKADKNIRIDFDSDPDARRNILDILENGARPLKAHEAAWLCSMSESQAYHKIPRIKTLGGVRFDCATVKQIRSAGYINKNSSLKIESKKLGLPKSFKQERKATLCLQKNSGEKETMAL